MSVEKSRGGEEPDTNPLRNVVMLASSPMNVLDFSDPCTYGGFLETPETSRRIDRREVFCEAVAL